MYSSIADPGRTEPNLNQGWTLPSAPPVYSELTGQGFGTAASAPPIIPGMSNLSLNPDEDLPPPTYDDAIRNTGKFPKVKI